MTTLDWNVSYTILYYVKEHFYILVSSFERESCEYPNFPVLLDWFRKKGHYLQLVVMMDKQGFGVRMVRLAHPSTSIEGGEPSQKKSSKEEDDRKEYFF